MKRELGYYWVYATEEWKVAYWEGEYWYVPGWIDACWHDCNFKIINETKLIPPNI